MLISILEKINNLNNALFAPLDNFFESLPFEDWINDAFIDSFHLFPFLFFIFIVIEVLEFYFSDKLDSCIKKSRKRSIAIGSLASLFPQCGFSIIASSLYSKKMITRGCLIAVYLGTSDETIPILLAHPEKAQMVIPIIGLKLFIAILGGYVIDIFSGHFNNPDVINKTDSIEEALEEAHEHIHEEGCCNHDLMTKNRHELILHPIFHTINILAFILVITLVLNYSLDKVQITEMLSVSNHHYMQCIIASLIGLIPNCAISIAITMMLIKGTITFGAAMSGLLANGGLGLLILLKNNKFKDSMIVIIILATISILAGCLIEYLV
ncbi:MAG: arsenic efflux protein [bacterium]|nr:arsenic efflux protein [bacterium]